MVMNADNLSITSLHFHVNNKPPEWVDHLLGGKSVFWKMYEEGEKRKILNTLEEGRKTIISHPSSPPAIAMTPSCSFELLGFVRVGSAEPFLLSDKHQQPSMGNAKLHLGGSGNNTSWPCYYRATYDNWRVTEYVGTDPFYWPIFFYCPAPTAQVCEEEVILNMEKNEEMDFSIQLNVIAKKKEEKKKKEQVEWNINMSMIMNPRVWDPPEATLTVADLAICSSMPYHSSQQSKQESVHAILMEWVRYYTTLDIHTVLYDATGRQVDEMQDSAYYQKQSLSPPTVKKMLERFDYHRYSILSLLYPQLKNMTYDNIEGINPVIMKLDDDHTYTLTHCRFDVEARLGIQNILVADFDEFLYCPQVGSQSRLQAEYLRASLLYEGKRYGFDQILLWQFVLGSRVPQDDIAECVAREAKAEKLFPSIYNCFASYSAYPANVQLHKSVHLTKTCPFNTDHHACASGTMSNVEDYDCLCDTKEVYQCVLFHLSLRPNDYKHSRPHSKYVNQTAAGKGRIRLNRTELSRVVRHEMVFRPRTFVRIF
eukprot:gene6921-7655_t